MMNEVQVSKDIATQLRLLEQWRLLLAQLSQKNPEIFKRLKPRVRQGIPETLRGVAWNYLAQCHGSIQKTLPSPEEKAKIYIECLNVSEAICENDVIRDVDRTFPKHILFREKGELGQRQLFAVLRSVSIYHSEVGYCQGMGFVAGFLLMFMPEVDVFWMFDLLLNNLGIAGLFKPGLPDLPLRFYQLEQLIRIHLPSIAQHLEVEGVDVSMFSSQWIMTLCTSSFPFKVLVRLWDNFLLDGFKMIFRICLALLKLVEREVIVLSFEQILIKIKSLPSLIDPDLLMTSALSIKVTRQQLKIKLITSNSTNHNGHVDKNNISSSGGHATSTVGQKQDRAMLVTSLSWTQLPPTSSCEPMVDIYSRLVPTSQREVVIGRQNGLVESFRFPDDFACPQHQKNRRRFHMPSKIVLAAPMSKNRLVCLCERGEGIIVNWNEEIWEREVEQRKTKCEQKNEIRSLEEETKSENQSSKPLSNEENNIIPCMSFRNVEFSNVPFKIHHGRKEKSDGTRPEQLPSIDISMLPFPLYDVMLEGNDKPLWLEKVFRVPGPVHCAALSERNPSMLAFGGTNNLVKVLDLERLQAVFSAKNKEPDSLGLTDKVEITSIRFLDIIGDNADVLAVGTKKGRLQIYDQKSHNKPVLEVAVCHHNRSVVALGVKPIYTCQIEQHHCCPKKKDNSNIENCSSNGHHCLVWSCQEMLKLQRGKACHQSLVITDNHGEIYRYDVIAVRKTRQQINSKLDEEIPEPPSKKRKWQPHRYNEYVRGTIVVPSASISPITYEVKPVHNFPFAMGSINGLCWSSMNQYIVGVSIGRHAYVWEEGNRKLVQRIYLKNRLTTSLWCMSVPFQKTEELRTSGVNEKDWEGSNITEDDRITEDNQIAEDSEIQSSGDVTHCDISDEDISDHDSIVDDDE